MNAPSTGCPAASPPVESLGTILDCVAVLEGLGFPRPASVSPDAYLSLFGELDPSWSADAAYLSRRYAELRFGGALRRPLRRETDDSVAIRSACDRLSTAVRGAVEGESTTACERWKARCSSLSDTAPEDVASPCVPETLCESGDAEVVANRSDSAAASKDAGPEASPARRSRGGRKALRAAALLLAASIVAGVGGATTSQPWKFVASTLGFGDVFAAEGLGEGDVVELWPPLRPSVDLEDEHHPRPPRFVPADYPQAHRFNRAIADCWAETAALYCDIGRSDRAGALYCYVARALPDDAPSQARYATFLLTAPDPVHRCPEIALQYARAAYKLDGANDLAAKAYAAALFANGHVAEAVAIQQERLERSESESGFAMTGDDSATDNSG